MTEFKIENLLSLDKTIAKDLFCGVTYPFEVLSKISDFIKSLCEKLDPDEFIKRDEYIFVHKSAKVAPTAFIAGPCIIDEGAEIRHCAFIRGSAIVGKNAVVGNSTELKNVILFDKVQVPHYNYVGDSVLGFGSHLGAGAITSNVKSDKKLVVLRHKDTVIETKLKKFGAILGDNVEVGCNTVLNPGTMVGKNTNIYPLSMVRGIVPGGCIYKKQGEIVEKL